MSENSVDDSVVPIDTISEKKSSEGAPAPDYQPPLACINKIVKATLPAGFQVTKEARQAFQNAAGIFMLYLTNCSNDICKGNKRQTIYPQDVMGALRELDFDPFDGPVDGFLQNWREGEQAKKRAKTDSQAAAAATGGDDDDDEVGEEEIEEEEEVEAEVEESNDDDDEGDDDDDGIGVDENDADALAAAERILAGME